MDKAVDKIFVGKPEEEIAILRQIVECKQCAIIKTPSNQRGLLMDVWTASLIIKVHDALSKKNQKALSEMPLAKKINVCIALSKMVME